MGGALLPADGDYSNLAPLEAGASRLGVGRPRFVPSRAAEYNQVVVSEPGRTLTTPQAVSVANASIAKFQVCSFRLPALNPRTALLH
jgi:hypothetical protein